VDGTRLEKHHALKGRKWDRICWNFPHAGGYQFITWCSDRSENGITFSGKGITDQDRNILSNQVLILGFYRSAAKMLQLGPMPSFTSTRRKKGGSDDENEDAAVSAPSDVGYEDGNDALSQTSSMETRGTVLITLRNVSPYTEWLVKSACTRNFYIIAYREIPRLAKNPPENSGTTPPNPRYILVRSFRFHRDIWSGYEHRMTKGERAYGKGTTGEGGEDRTWEFCLRD
jgi:25S rRNA (uracil2634-N3)-methyltransferase